MWISQSKANQVGIRCYKYGEWLFNVIQDRSEQWQIGDNSAAQTPAEVQQLQTVRVCVTKHVTDIEGNNINEIAMHVFGNCRMLQNST